MNTKYYKYIFYAIVIIFFGTFLFYPLSGVFAKTFFFNNHLSFDLFLKTITGPLVITSLGYSFLLGITAVALSTFIALPLAIFVAEYRFFGRKIASALVLIPMILPPFVGAIGIKQVLSRFGMLNMLLATEPFDWMTQTGFYGVALLQALHLFPIMYLNISAALSNVDPRLKEAALISGGSPWSVFKKITFPLLMPGFLSGAIIVFLWSFTDLGTPLIMGFRKVIAIEIFDRSVSMNNDPTGPAMVTIIILITCTIMFLFKSLYKSNYFSTTSKGYSLAELKKPTPLLHTGIVVYIFIILIFSLMPHVGLVLTSFAQEWFMTVLPHSYTGAFFGDALQSEGVLLSVKNSLFYSSLSTIIDIVLGFCIAWVVVRKKIKAGIFIDAMVMIPIALPGIILAFGYVATFSGTFLDPLKNPVPLLIMGFALRRLPYCFRAAHAGLEQLSPEFEDTARLCGAKPLRAVLTTSLPLSAGALIAGGILSFMFAMLEVSESMILAVKKEFFPITRAIYDLFGKIPDGDAVASALGVLCMLFLAIGIIVTSIVFGKQMGKMFRL